MNDDITRMSRTAVKNTLSLLYDGAVTALDSGELDASSKEVAKKYLDQGFTLFAGLVDAILEIRDNSIPAVEDKGPGNPYGPEFQKRVGTP